ncbi:MAG: nucleotidyltransferase [Clostridia bacterium]|nr:nucleotidyltransferase [Clostridia bacterium]
MDKTLVIMAAGMGSRFGGLKQMEPVGPNNSIIIDYSIYDAVKNGFNKVVFIIKKENEQIFKEVVGDKISKLVKVEYVFQDVNNLPDGYAAPEGRVKPWGTGHAIYSRKGVVNEPFMVINADDFYGRDAFSVISEWIESADFNAKPSNYAMAAYKLNNTLTENGTVSRGVCSVDENNFLTDVVERTKILRKEDGKIYFTEDEENWVELPENVDVSMNCWCFPSSFINEIEKYFKEFLDDALVNNPLKSEFYLPFIVKDMLHENKCTVKVLETAAKWFGVTYKEDKPGVVESVNALVKNGVYPEILWN